MVAFSVGIGLILSALMVYFRDTQFLYGVLIVLWIMATVKLPSNFPMIICFVVFLVNDLYGFISWQRRRKIQANS